jgi:hypothetical protein
MEPQSCENCIHNNPPPRCVFLFIAINTYGATNPNHISVEEADFICPNYSSEHNED